MSFMDRAKPLMGAGFYLFPILHGAKTPLIEKWQEFSSQRAGPLAGWDLRFPQANVGVFTGKYGHELSDKPLGALLVVDVDVKAGKLGEETIFKLDAEGRTFPATFTVKTPSGGRHLYYFVEKAVKSGTDVLGSGVDIRSAGGYVVGPGSQIGGKLYEGNGLLIAPAPEWLIAACGKPRERSPKSGKKKTGIKFSEAAKRAIHYLESEAPLALEGAGGDHTTFQVACRVKDFGVEAETCFNLMLEFWNDKCSPPWEADALLRKVENAYAYGANEIGAASAEAAFAEAAFVEASSITPATPEETSVPEGKDPFDKLNESFAFVTAGGGHHILWETTDRLGRFKLEHLYEATFHKKFASWTMTIGNGKTHPVTELWMKSPKRRSYEGMCFAPGLQVDPKWYNIWKGFAVEALPPGELPTAQARKSLDMFLEHALENVCGGDFDLFTWLVGYFAHLVQKPHEKPLVALVFKGLKGVGKNALVERIKYLLGYHSMVVSDKRYLLGNFNGFLERMLLFILDEAFWSGDKQAEGVLKSLITGSEHVIEHKGKEPYTVENCTRVVIIGNEDWLVPATQDERRFAVFSVGSKRIQDRKFFHDMRVWMEEGGYSLLLRYLLDFDLKGIDVNAAPSTEGLHEQKIKSLQPVARWWFESLNDGRISASDANAWPVEIEKETLRRAFVRFQKENGITARPPEARAFGKFIKTFCPAIDSTQKKRIEDRTISVYRLPELGAARKRWQEYIGHSVNWGE